jgi:hypothetical protein
VWRRRRSTSWVWERVDTVVVSKKLMPEEVRAIVASKIELIELIVEELLTIYVREESDLAGHLQHAGNRLDEIMKNSIDDPGAFKKVPRRW